MDWEKTLREIEARLEYRLVRRKLNSNYRIVDPVRSRAMPSALDDLQTLVKLVKEIKP